MKALTSMILLKQGKTGFLLIAMTGTLGQKSGTLIVAGNEWIMGPDASDSLIVVVRGILGFTELFPSSDPSFALDEKYLSDK